VPKRRLKFTQAIREALDLCMAKDPTVYLMGLGVPDPKGVFGTTLGLEQKHGRGRVMDMPASENGMTGVALGSALVGMRPVISHQRIDFALLAMDQIVNQAAKWHFMFGGQLSVPMVIRLIVGRGWGQGPQHSQSLQAWFAHIPGLKVVMPTSPLDAKGLLIASIEDNNPVIFIEHRWLHNVTGWVPEGVYRLPLGKAKIIREGKDVTIVAASYMTVESLRAADRLAEEGIAAEIIDLRTLSPLDDALILKSVRKTGRLIVADTGCKSFGSSAEIVAKVAEEALGHLKSPPIRVSLPDCPAPTAPSLANQYYPLTVYFVAAAKRMMGLSTVTSSSPVETSEPLDVPDVTFAGPF
jgi:pyruvate dehydrogenase E1 component beta subunit